MTLVQWNALQVGNILIYTGDRYHTSYIGTLCEIIEKDPDTAELTLKIILTGIEGNDTWGNCSLLAAGWFRSAAIKFTLHSSTPASLPDRIHQKIKTLDDKWAQTQAKKGNKYAVFLLRCGTV